MESHPQGNLSGARASITGMVDSFHADRFGQPCISHIAEVPEPTVFGDETVFLWSKRLVESAATTLARHSDISGSIGTSPKIETGCSISWRASSLGDDADDRGARLS